MRGVLQFSPYGRSAGSPSLLEVKNIAIQKPTQDPVTKPAAPEQPPKTKARISELALVSLIFAIWIVYPHWRRLCGIAAVITAALALWLISRSRGKVKGTKIAIAAMILGMVGILFFPVITSLEVWVIKKLPPSLARPAARFTGLGMMVYGAVRARTSRVNTDLRTIAIALEAYYNEHNSYPAWAIGEAGANSFAGPQAAAFHIHTFRIWQNDTEVGTFATLTTPVPYLPSYLRDPFAWATRATYGYYSNEHGFIVYSGGPDMDERLVDSWDLEPDVEFVYKSIIAQPSLTLLAGTSSLSHEAYTYDPTNGIYTSAGDIWRVRQ